MKVTIKDIANECQVSKATVSRYLNGSGYVSIEVADRIKKSIEEMNYVPSATARSLSTQKSNVVGIVTPESNNLFFAEVFKGMSEVAEECGLSVIYINTYNNKDTEMKALNSLRTNDICGLIITPINGGKENETYIKNLKQAIDILNVPVVVFDREIEGSNWYGVYSDNEEGAYKCTKLLIDKGHKNIATITGDMNLKLGQLRHKGFLKAIHECNDIVDKPIILKGDFTTETAYIQTLKLLTQNRKLTAIFSPNNQTTIGILKAMFEQNLKVPEDIGVVGFDDIQILNDLHIPISVLKRNTFKMGKICMELLHELCIEDSKDQKWIAAAGEKKTIIVESELIIRGSEELNI